MDTILKAVRLVENDEIEKGLKILKTYVKKTKSDDEKYTVAELYLNWGFLEEAAEILKELIDKYPDEFELKMSLADIYIEREDDDQALELLSKIDKNAPEYVQALLQMADLYQVQGLFEVAEQKLLEAKSLMPNETIIDFALGELFFSNGEYIKALTHYEKVAEHHESLADVSISERLGEAYAAAGKYEKALEYYKEDEAEENPDKLFKYGITAHQAKRNDIAVNAWKKVIELDQYYHSVYYHLAVALEEEGMLQEAYETVLQGIKVDEFNKELYFLAGVLSRKLGEDKSGEEYVRQAIALDPDYKEAVLYLIEFLKEEGNHSQIIDLILEIEKTGSVDSLYDWELARAYSEEELYDEAYESYQKAYKQLFEDSDFLKEYGYFLIEEGRSSESIHVFESYLKHVPGDFEVEEFLARLKQTEDI